MIMAIPNTSKEAGENRPMRGCPNPIEASRAILYKLSILPRFVFEEETLSQLSTTTSMTARQIPYITLRKNHTGGLMISMCMKPAAEAIEAKAAKERTYPTDRITAPDKNVPIISPM